MPQLRQCRGQLAAVLGGMVEDVSQYVIHLQIKLDSFDIAVVKGPVKLVRCERSYVFLPFTPKRFPRSLQIREGSELLRRNQPGWILAPYALQPGPLSAVAMNRQAV